jgi:transcriptional regulator with XRE-family HTH domain
MYGGRNLTRMTNLPEWSLADRLRKIRRDRHMTQDEMAHRLGIKPVTYSAWEAGRNRPEDVVQLASLIESRFGVPAAWTLGVLPGSHDQLVGAEVKWGRRSTDLAFSAAS